MTEVQTSEKPRISEVPEAVNLGLIADSLPVLIAYADRQLVYRYANRTFIEWTAKPFDDIVGHPVREVLGDKYFQHIKPHIDKALNGESALYEADVELSKDHWAHFRTTLFPHADESGNVVGYFILASDISDSRGIEEKANKAEQRLIDAIESLTDEFILFDAEGTLVLCNSVYQRFNTVLKGKIKPGINYREILRTNIENGLHPEAKGREEEFIEAFIRDRYESNEDREIKIGPDRWLLLRDRKTANGDLVCVRTDISDLKRREARLRLLSTAVEFSPTAIFVTDSKGYIEYVNPRYELLFGYSANEIVGEHMSKLKSDETPEKTYTELWETISSGREWRGELVTPRKDGTTFWEKVTAAPVFAADGSIANYVSINEDVTEQKRREQELRQLSMAVDQNPASVMICDLEGKLVYVNGTFTQVTGYTAEEVIGKRATFLQSDQAPSNAYSEIREARLDRRTWIGELLTKRKDGTTFLARTSISPIEQPDGAVTHFLYFSEDISELKKHETKLRQLSLAVEQSPAAIVISDPQARIEYVNSKFESLTGYRLSEISGKPTGLLRSERTPAETYREIDQAMAADGEWRGELATRRKDGSIYLERVVITSLKSEDENLVSHLRISEDITELKEKEERLRQSEALFRGIFEAAGTGMAIVGVDGKVVEVNAAFANMLDFSREEMAGLDVLAITHPDDHDSTREDMARQANGEDSQLRDAEPPLVEKRYVKKNGDTVWVSRTRSVVRDDNGVAKFFVGHSQDITPRKEAEEALRRSEERFRSIFETAATGLTIVDSSGNITGANPAYCQLLGYSRDEIRGLTIYDVTHPDDRESTRKQFAEITSGRDLKKGIDHGRSLEKRLLRKDGSFVWVLLTRSIVREPDGAYMYLIGQHQDISERKAAEEALKKSEERFRVIVEALDHISDGIEIIEADEKFLYCNAKQREFYPESAPLYDVPGTPMEELVRAVAYGGRVHSAIGREEAWIKDRMVDFREGGNPPREFRQPDGRWLYVREHRTDDGALVCVRTDITEQKQRDADIRKSQEMLQAVTANLFEGVLVLDEGGIVQFVNPAAAEFLHSGIGENLTGRHFDSIARVWNGRSFTGFADGPLKRAIDSGEFMRDDDGMFQTAEGEHLEVAFACTPVAESFNDKSSEERSHIHGCIVSFRDIKNVKAAQRDSLQALKLASVGELAAGIAHEINTPSQYIGDNLRFIRDGFETMSTAVVAFRSLVEALRDNEKFDTLIKDFEKSVDIGDLEFLLSEIPAAADQSLSGVEQISRIVSAMKEFSHPGAKEKVPTDINKAIDNTVTVSRNEWKHIAEMEMDLDSSLPPVLCLSGELNQVILNLIVNAAHAIGETKKGDKGTIKIATAQTDSEIEISISDDGAGIPADIQDRIFDPFFTTKEVGKGTGQGLAICHDVVVNKHGGTISCTSAPGVGTTFTVRLPSQPREAMAGAAE